MNGRKHFRGTNAPAFYATASVTIKKLYKNETRKEKYCWRNPAVGPSSLIPTLGQ